MAARRTPQGVRGLKPCLWWPGTLYTLSHSARSAWIETVSLRLELVADNESHSARSAWIETVR